MTKRKNGTTEGRKANWKRTKTMAMSIKTDYQRSLCGNMATHHVILGTCSTRNQPSSSQ